MGRLGWLMLTLVVWTCSGLAEVGWSQESSDVDRQWGFVFLKLVGNPRLQKDMKLTPEQLDKLASIPQDLLELFASLPEKERAPVKDAFKAMELAMKEHERRVSEVLSVEQQIRAKQVVHQQVLLTNSAASRFRHTLSKADYEKLLPTLQGIDNDLEGDLQKIYAERAAFEKELEATLLVLLREDQAKSYRELFGEPFVHPTELRTRLGYKPPKAPRASPSPPRPETKPK